MSDFLLELRCEEIPARMQAGARRDLEKAFREHLAATGVTHGDISVWSTPRRLALIARDLPEATAAVREEFKGPKTGAPPQALEGFLRKVGLRQDQLEDRGGTWFAVVERPGRATREVLTWAMAAIVRTFAWPKSMRWGAASLSTESLRWVRPLSGIVAIFGEDPVDVTIGGVASGVTTLGHRFHHPGAITIGGAHDYIEKLRACHVLVDHAEREGIVREMARVAAVGAGLTLVEDEGLVIENAGLTEWPVPLLGRFDPAFLDVPPEVIRLTARTNQKYFVCEDAAGKLANAFVCTANIAASDGGAAIVDGNRKVLAARLSDARFFWDQDRTETLAQHAEGLARITFHEKLGTVADKVERVAKLARWLVEEGIVQPSPLQGRWRSGAAAEGVGAVDQPLRQDDSPHPNPSPEGEGLTRARLADMAEQAARLCKADLVTEMVGEFPELQGLMGGYYAHAEGLPDEVADAIRDHYKPVGQGDDVPTAPVTVAVSLADKLDTLIVFFYEDLLPTGSKDPFALRRAALGAIQTVISNGIRLGLGHLISYKMPYFAGFQAGRENTRLVREMLDARREAGYQVTEQDQQDAHAVATSRMKISGMAVDMERRVKPAAENLLSFFADRLKVQQREAGVHHDLIDAVFALGGEDDLVRLLARVHALQAFVGTADGANLLAGYKRAANILKKEGVVPANAGTGGLIDAESRPDASGPGSEAGTTYLLSYTPELAEQSLIDALDSAEPTASAAVEAEDFAGAMTALASLRAPIDLFFEEVTVNDADPAKRAARLALLGRFRAAVHRVADFSKIEG